MSDCGFEWAEGDVLERGPDTLAERARLNALTAKLPPGGGSFSFCSGCPERRCPGCKVQPPAPEPQLCWRCSSELFNGAMPKRRSLWNLIARRRAGRG